MAMSKNFYIWEGIYSNFDEAEINSKGKGFGGDTYKQRSINATRESITALKEGLSIPFFHKQRSTILTPVIAMILSQKQNKIKLLDFGGGFGIGYLTLIESLPESKKMIDYLIVEVPEVCNSAQELFKDYDIKYINKLPEKDSFDLIHSSSALQYVENWKGILQQFASYKSKYILLSDVFAGRIPTFVTLQNYYESKIKHWFLNLDELVSALKLLDYSLIMKTQVSSK